LLCILEDGDATPARASRHGVRGARFVTLRRVPLLAGDAPPPSRADAFGSRERRRAVPCSVRCGIACGAGTVGQACPARDPEDAMLVRTTFRRGERSLVTDGRTAR